MSVPAYSDISRSSNDLLNRDFYHLAPANLEIKSKTPNGVAFTVKGKTNSNDDSIAGSLEAKYTDKATGLTLTQGWTTANALDTKIELSNALIPGLKSELLTTYFPDQNKRNAKLNFHFSQPNFYGRAFFDLLKGPTFIGDATFGNNGFVFGTEFAFDVSTGSMNRYAAGLGYFAPTFTASVTSQSKFSVFTGSYYHKVSPATEVGANAVYDSSASSGVNLEVGTKHKLDDSSFVKAKINSQAIAALAYSQALRPGVRLGLGVSFDTQKLNQSAHKLGLSLSFEA